MKMKLLTLISLCALVILSSCKKDPQEVLDIPLTNKQARMVSSGNEFSFKLLQKVNESESTPKNIMVSPLSVHFALAMTANGARNNTLQQMLTALDFDDYSVEEFNEYSHDLMNQLTGLDEKVTLSIANSIWYRNTFQVSQDFLDVNQQYYDAEVHSIDFASASAPGTINDWVNDATRGKIDKIVDNISEDMVMYLINAIYFYGSWKYEFEKSKTSDMDFTTGTGSIVQARMMQNETELRYFGSEDVTIVELPYGRGNFVMDVLLPAYGETTTDLISDLDADQWNAWNEVMGETEVHLYMPKFTFAYEKTLNEMLINMGMSDLFAAGLADLTGINPGGGLVVSEVKHKTFIDVDEEGTEAAAVTSVGVELTSVPAGPVTVILDRPFVFMIRESTTGAVLFSGVVNNPVE